jgi:hypothetical protein
MMSGNWGGVEGEGGKHKHTIQKSTNTKSKTMISSKTPNKFRNQNRIHPLSQDAALRAEERDISRSKPKSNLSSELTHGACTSAISNIIMEHSGGSLTKSGKNNFNPTKLIPPPQDAALRAEERKQELAKMEEEAGEDDDLERQAEAAEKAAEEAKQEAERVRKRAEDAKREREEKMKELEKEEGGIG